MRRYFLFTGPLNHLFHFEKRGYVQQNYNHKKRLQELSEGDYVVLYASNIDNISKKPYRKFMAVGRVIDPKIYTATVKGQKFYRMKVKFLKFTPVLLSTKINKLSFLRNKKYYGLYLISGFRELSKRDFDVILG